MRHEFDRYADRNGYTVDSWEKQTCDCGSSLWRLYSDDTEGGAYLVCKCGAERDIQDNKKYIQSGYQNICNCDNEFLFVYVGRSYYDDSVTTSWLYVAAECPECDLAGIYVDWKER